MAEQPKRIQRKRSKGWRMPEGVVYVGRPTKWGNPYRPGRYAKPPCYVGCMTFVEDPRDAVFLYWIWLKRTPEGGKVVEDARRELRGKDLACWCSLDKPCHADVLLEIANQEGEVQGG